MDGLQGVGAEGEMEMTRFGLMVMKDRNVHIQKDPVLVHRISVVDKLSLAFFA